MNSLLQLTPICKIGREHSLFENVILTKTFSVEGPVKRAVVRLLSECVCGLYINGEFIEATIGRYPQRILNMEITSRLREGENGITLVLSSHYFQRTAQKDIERRQFWFAYAAAELQWETADGAYTLVTDESWEDVTEEVARPADVFSQVKVAEYERFWKHAALWEEQLEPPTVPEEVLRVAGEDYVTYINTPAPQYAFPQEVLSSNCLPSDNTVPRPDSVPEGANYALYDFGRLYVGYTTLEYEAEEDGEVTFYYEYSEDYNDFSTTWKLYGLIKRLALTRPLQKGRHTLQLIHRRASRYMLVCLPGNAKICDFKMKISMLPARKKGYFRSSDPMLDRIWEVGKYTLEINKHQEYESCPRNEMKFFSGDGIITALVDYHVFGSPALTDASLSFTEPAISGGARFDPLSENDALWDYPAWRIIMAYNHYLYYGDLSFVRHYYEDLTSALVWMIGKIGRDNLVYQFTCYFDVFYTSPDAVEFTCSEDRLGRKPMLNALYYKSLLCMAEMGEQLGDVRAAEWRALADEIRIAINEHLWSEKMGGYVDQSTPDCIPQDGNALSLLFGVADPARATSALNALKKHNHSPYGSTLLSKETSHTRGGSKTISPMMTTFETEARFLYGDSADALDLLRRCWGTMIQKGAETFWEFSHNDPDKCWLGRAHGWSSGCCYLLSAYVLGIRPTSPGYEGAIFAPNGDLDSFHGVVTTVKGYVAVRCETHDGKKYYTVVYPKTLPLTVRLPAGSTVEEIRY